MSYQVLARKWRPRKFDELIGQTHVVRALANALDAERLHHAYLFTGTRGVGKTTVARIFARALNCELGVTATPCGECSSCREIDEGRFVDLIEVDAASRTKVDETRELLENVQYAPTRGRFKVYLIDEVHMFSNHSFNALLKTLEEPPPHVKFLLATTDPKKLPVTILSRCLQFSLKRLSTEQIVVQLVKILEAEGVERDTEALRLIAEAADGSMRDGLSLLDQALAYGDGQVGTEDVISMLGSVHYDQVVRLIELIAENDAVGLIEHVREMAEFGTDFSQVLADLLAELQKLAITQALAGEDPDTEPRIRDLADRISAEDCQLFYQIALLGRRDLPYAPDAKGGLEMILLRMLAFRPLQPTASDVGGIVSNTDAGSASLGPSVKAASGTVPSGDPRTVESRVDGAPTLSVEQWPAVVESLGLTGLVHQLASNCAFQLKDGARLELVLSSRNEQLYNSKAKAKMEEALRERYNNALTLDIMIAQERDVASPVQQQRATDRERLTAAQEAIKADPNVQALCSTFDAEIEQTDVRDLS